MVNPRRHRRGALPGPAAAAVEWRIDDGPVPYPEALAVMEARAAAIAAGEARELVWLLEHPPLYTAGTSARSEHLLARRFPVFAAGRGGQFTYHGPGQRVAYVMLDLRRRGADIRRFVAGLEEWLIRALGGIRDHGRAPRGSDRRVGAPPRQGRGRRGQDRGDRHKGEALGQPAWRQPECRSGSCAISPASCHVGSPTLVMA